jgi:putative protease
LKKPELLSPAGNFEKLKIALAYGADAVYGGVSHFSLRIRSSKEFTYESFAEAIEYTHSLGKKIYVTINGFPFNNQLKLLEEHLKKMADMKPDAFIISTPGVIGLAKKVAPQIPLHLSTQANVLNYLDAQFYYDQGVSRIIAAREISLRDLEEIKKHIPDLELEVFVHGSMCFAYSGRCLVSAVQMGRVPNRGSCANDCRFEYTLYAENEEHGTLFRLEEQPDIGTYIFNSKDMNLASHLDELIKSGVIDSLKIEGRTKSAYYAAITASTYRDAIDDYFEDKFDAQKYQKELHTTKHRGFSDAYLISRPFEKHDTQKHDNAISSGSHEVAGLVREDGEYFMCKYKIFLNEDIELILPKESKIDYIDNEFGTIFARNGKNYIRFYRLLAESGKELEEIHSGNLNPIKLPIKLPSFSIFRKPIEED